MKHLKMYAVEVIRRTVEDYNLETQSNVKVDCETLANNLNHFFEGYEENNLKEFYRFEGYLAGRIYEGKNHLLRDMADAGFDKVVNDYSGQFYGVNKTSTLDWLEELNRELFSLAENMIEDVKRTKYNLVSYRLDALEGFIERSRKTLKEIDDEKSEEKQKLLVKCFMSDMDYIMDDAVSAKGEFLEWRHQK